MFLFWSEDTILTTLNRNPYKIFKLKKMLHINFVLPTHIIDSNFEEL